MKLDKPIIIPDKDRTPFFDSDDLQSGTYTFKCVKCNDTIKVNCCSIYVGAWDSNFSDTTIKAIENHFSINEKQNTSFERGWPSITKQYCIQCGTPYIVVADFYEYRNSVYCITIQGLAKCW